MNVTKLGRCPYCAKIITPRIDQHGDAIVPTHDFPPPCRSVCPGTGQAAKPTNYSGPFGKDE